MGGSCYPIFFLAEGVEQTREPTEKDDGKGDDDGANGDDKGPKGDDDGPKSDEDLDDDDLLDDDPPEPKKNLDNNGQVGKAMTKVASLLARSWHRILGQAHLSLSQGRRPLEDLWGSQMKWKISTQNRIAVLIC